MEKDITWMSISSQSKSVNPQTTCWWVL